LYTDHSEQDSRCERKTRGEIVAVTEKTTSRFPADPSAEAGWQVQRLTPPSSLFGANGIQFGPDGRLYIAQCEGCQVAALDTSSGEIEPIVALEGFLTGPDDVAFDAEGALYVTDVMGDRVVRLSPAGDASVIAEGTIGANGLTCVGNRIFANECREGGRLFEVFHDGREPRVLLEDVMTPNAMMAGPDGLLYFPLVHPGEVWRTTVDGTNAEKVTDQVEIPTAVKFGPQGRLMVVTGAGVVASVDLAGGAVEVVANYRYGIDNLAFSPDGSLFVSSFLDGSISRLRSDGSWEEVVHSGFVGPYGVAAFGGGSVAVADGNGLAICDGAGHKEYVATRLAPGFPGLIRGMRMRPDGSLLTTTTEGLLSSYRVGGTAEMLLEGLEEPIGVDVAGGRAVFAETGAGRVLEFSEDGTKTALAEGLDRPFGIALGADACFVTERGTGRVLKISGAGIVESIADGLGAPEGIALLGEELLVVDVEGKQVVGMDPAGGARRVIARDLPVGDPPGVVPRLHPGAEIMPGPLTAFADLVAADSSTAYLSANGDGSILMLSRR
jgi:sugar lactone lactonase YvrE